jgi:hypothetical protein
LILFFSYSERGEKLREAIDARVAKMKEDIVCVEREAKDRRSKSQEREAPVTADIRQVAGRLGAQLEAVAEEDCGHLLAGAEMLRASQPLGREFRG